MFSKKTKWIPFGNYSYAGTDYIVFVRGNKKTGMMEFKVKKVHAWTIFVTSFTPYDLIDVKVQWGEIKNLLNQ